jgi:aspartate oxidase
MAEEMESMMSNTVNIKRAQQDIERLLNDVEKLKDKIRESNGSH